MLHPSNGDEDEDLHRQENKRCRANGAASRNFRSAVEVGALPCPRTAVDDTAITLYSASRLGQSDLGVNTDRLENLHAALVAVQATS